MVKFFYQREESCINKMNNNYQYGHAIGDWNMEKWQGESIGSLIMGCVLANKHKLWCILDKIQYTIQRTMDFHVSNTTFFQVLWSWSLQQWRDDFKINFQTLPPFNRSFWVCCTWKVCSDPDFLAPSHPSWLRFHTFSLHQQWLWPTDCFWMLSHLIWFPLQSFAFKYSLKSNFHIRLIPLGLDNLFSPTDYRLFGTSPTSPC